MEFTKQKPAYTVRNSYIEEKKFHTTISNFLVTVVKNDRQFDPAND